MSNALPINVVPSAGVAASDAGSAAGVPVRHGLRALVGDGSVNQPRLPMLAGIVDRLAGSLAINFRIISRGSADARSEPPHPTRFAEFMETVPPFALIAV